MIIVNKSMINLSKNDKNKERNGEFFSRLGMIIYTNK